MTPRNEERRNQTVEIVLMGWSMFFGLINIITWQLGWFAVCWGAFLVGGMLYLDP